MIECYEGRLGGGKTYSAVVRIVDHLRRGGLVATNVELKWDRIVEYVGDRFGVVVESDQIIRLADEQIGLFHRHTPSGTPGLPVLVVIDEAHLTFNSRDYAKTDKLYRETLTFLTQSRKVHTDVIFISQSVLNMDKQFMRLVQFIWRFRDLSKWKIPGLGLAWPINQILCVQFDYDGRTILQRQFINKDKRIFALYETNSLLREFPRLDGAKTQRELKRVEKGKSKMGKWLIPIGLVTGVVCVVLLIRSLGSFGKPSATTVGSGVTAARVSPSAAVKSQDPKQAAYLIYTEHLETWNPLDYVLETVEGGWYGLGEMSSKGYVVAVSPKRAKVITPDGKTAWIVAMRSEPLTKTESQPARSHVAHADATKESKDLE
jgi:Zonular occludens toxin (Zot)